MRKQFKIILTQTSNGLHACWDMETKNYSNSMSRKEDLDLIESIEKLLMKYEAKAAKEA